MNQFDLDFVLIKIDSMLKRRKRLLFTSPEVVVETCINDRIECGISIGQQCSKILKSIIPFR